MEDVNTFYDSVSCTHHHLPTHRSPFSRLQTFLLPNVPFPMFLITNSLNPVVSSNLQNSTKKWFFQVHFVITLLAKD